MCAYDSAYGLFYTVQVTIVVEIGMAEDNETSRLKESEGKGEAGVSGGGLRG